MPTSAYERFTAFIQTRLDHLTKPSEGIVTSCRLDLHERIGKDDDRFGCLFSLVDGDFHLSVGGGLAKLGFNERTFKRFALSERMPAAYGVCFTEYLIAAVKYFDKHPNKELWFMQIVPIAGNKPNEYFKTIVRIWIIDHQEYNQLSRTALILFDPIDKWNMTDHPIISVGKIQHPKFENALDGVKADMKKMISKYMFEHHLNFNAIEIRIIILHNLGLTSLQIGESIKKHNGKQVNVHAYNVKIKAECDRNFGQLSNAKQWADYLNKVFALDAL